MGALPRSSLLAWMFATILYGVVFYFQGVRKDARWIDDTSVLLPFIEGVLVSTLAYVLLFVSLQKYYLTWSSQRWPLLASWATLAAMYPLLSGLLLASTRTDITFVGPFSDAVSWSLAAQTFLFGQYAVLAAAGTSLLWTADDAAVGGVRRARAVAMKTLSEIMKMEKVGQPQYESLKDSLELLASEGGKATGRILLPADATVLRKWISAAQTASKQYLQAADASDIKPSDQRLTDLHTSLKSTS